MFRSGLTISIRSKSTTQALCFVFLGFFGLINKEDADDDDDDDADSDSNDNVFIIFNCGI